MSNKSKITVVTHDSHFHTDDVFAVATLFFVLEKDFEINVIRTRDKNLIYGADYVVDVGGIYDQDKNRFDHHQVGLAGVRKNKIPYASFGLVWRKYGAQISGSSDIADMIDECLVQPIDAIDNGVAIYDEIIKDVRPFMIQSAIYILNPTWNEDQSLTDKIFLQAVDFAKMIIGREVKVCQDQRAGERFVLEAYNKSSDKRIVILDADYPWDDILSKFPEPIYAVFPKDNTWRIKTVRDNLTNFNNRKDLPVSWAGKSGVELSSITGVQGGVFCHNKLFLAVAETKEAALAMVRIAIEYK